MGWFQDQGIDGAELGGYAGPSAGGGAGIYAPTEVGGMESSPVWSGAPTSAEPGGFAGPASTSTSSTWTPGSGPITPEQAIAQFGVDPSVAPYWAGKINTGDPYYIQRLQQDNAGTGPDGKGGVTGGGAAGGYAFGGGAAGPMQQYSPADLHLPSAAPDVKVNVGSFTPTAFNAPAPFVAPDPSQIQNDPGYQWRVKQATDTLQASAAAKGLLNDPKTLKAISDYTSGAASDEYQNVYNRAFNTYQGNFSNALNANQVNNSTGLNAFNANTSAALGAGQIALGNREATNSYNLGAGNLALGYTNAANNYQLGSGQLGLGYYSAGNANQLGWANYGLNANQQDFNQNYAFPISTGLQAADALGGFGSQYGANGSNLITGAGNAGAAGRVGSGNAWNSAYGTIGNNAMGAYYMSQYGAH